MGLKKNMIRVWLRENPIGTELLPIALALYFTLGLNGLFWDRIVVQDLAHASADRVIYLFALGLAMVSAQAAFLSAFSWGRLAKLAAISFTLIAAVAHYYSATYGILFDTGMLRNVLATDAQETLELITTDLIVSICLFSALPIALIIVFPIQPLPWYRRAISKALTMLVLIGVTVVCLTANYKTFSAEMRNQREIRHLIVPISPLVSLARVLGSRTAEVSVQKRPLDLNAVRKLSVGGDARPRLTVVVVGETVRAQNWGLSGYSRQTTPHLSQLSRTELFNFSYAQACGTSTEVSVPCMFSVFGLEKYDERKIRQTESVLSLLQRLGVMTSWIDNQSGCKGACDGVPTFTAGSSGIAIIRSESGGVLDENLIGALRNTISPTPVDQVIVLHMIGNHGPAYSDRYPEDYAKFLPECKDKSLANCDQSSITNSYDNAILYADYVLSRLIEQLKALPDRDVALTYVSDHGESLGEGGLYLHGLPRFIAPEEQLRVPFFFWIPAATQRSLRVQTDCLTKTASTFTTHDLLAHTLLGFYDVRTSEYRDAHDFLWGCRG